MAHGTYPNRHSVTPEGDGLLIIRRQDGTIHHVLYDVADTALVSAHSWSVDHYGYATKQALKMHRLILGLGAYDGTDVDHINGVRLDNRRANLRPSTRRDNIANQAIVNSRGSSRYRGVSWDRTRNAWQAKVKRDGRVYNLGRHSTEEAAATAVAAFRARHAIPSGY